MHQDHIDDIRRCGLCDGCEECGCDCDSTSEDDREPPPDEAPDAWDGGFADNH